MFNIFINWFQSIFMKKYYYMKIEIQKSKKDLSNLNKLLKIKESRSKELVLLSKEQVYKELEVVIPSKYIKNRFGQIILYKKGD